MTTAAWGMPSGDSFERLQDLAAGVSNSNALGYGSGLLARDSPHPRPDPLMPRPDLASALAALPERSLPLRVCCGCSRSTTTPSCVAASVLCVERGSRDGGRTGRRRHLGTGEAKHGGRAVLQKKPIVVEDGRNNGRSGGLDESEE